jgi:hypothetical protein
LNRGVSASNGHSRSGGWLNHHVQVRRSALAMLENHDMRK